MSDKPSDLKIEAGKYYKCRDGRRVFIAGRNPFSERFCWVGVLEDCTSAGATWRDDGRFADVEHECDLIAEWREPRTWEVEAVVLEYPHGAVQPVVTSYPESFGCKIIARRKLTLTEGEGCE